MNESAPRGRVLKTAGLLVFLAPIIAYWIYSLLIQPAPHYYAIDPEYEYFLNSLAVFRHESYVYVDHPGTPVEMLGTAILAATYPWLANRPEGFIHAQLQDPQLFLRLAYGLLILLHLVCVVIFFRLALRSTRPSAVILAGALATAYFAIQPYAFSGSVMWSHNSFSFPLGTLLLLWLYSSLTSDKNREGIPIGTWIGLGLGTGILTAVTIFLAAWAVGMLVAIILYYWLSRLPWRSMALAVTGFGLSALSGFYVAVLPVINKMGSFWRWIYSILTHQSNYLAVPKDQPAMQRIAANTANLLQLLPVLFIAMSVVIALAIIAVVLWKARLRGEPALWSLAGGLSTQMLVLTLVFLDRPLRAYYFLGVAAIVPVLLMVVLRLYERTPLVHRVLAAGISAAVLIGLAANSVQAIGAEQAQAQEVAGSEQLIHQAVSERAGAVNQPADRLTLLWMYGSYSRCWGLRFADQRTSGVFEHDISQICPNQYELAGRVFLPNAKAPLQAVKWDIIFTCDRYVDNVQPDAPGADVRHYPTIEWACGKVAVIFNR